MRPFVPGQWVNIRAFVGRRLIKRDRLRIKPSPNHSYGRFVETLASPSAGEVVVSATHARTPQLSGFTAKRAYQALDVHVGPGSTGRFVQLVQQRLAALHFYIPQTGVYDNGTELAIDAYHRLLGWGTYKTLDGRTISFLLNGWGQFKVRFPNHGRHAEGNLSKQLLALIDGSKVDLIFPISSGKPSTPTILGDFHVYQRTPGYLPDGMYYSDFFIRGYAIHGYDPAPDLSRQSRLHAAADPRRDHRLQLARDRRLGRRLLLTAVRRGRRCTAPGTRGRPRRRAARAASARSPAPTRCWS